jgi:hypothetical protein
MLSATAGLCSSTRRGCGGSYALPLGMRMLKVGQSDKHGLLGKEIAPRATA